MGALAGGHLFQKHGTRLWRFAVSLTRIASTVQNVHSEEFVQALMSSSFTWVNIITNRSIHSTGADF